MHYKITADVIKAIKLITPEGVDESLFLVEEINRIEELFTKVKSFSAKKAELSKVHTSELIKLEKERQAFFDNCKHEIITWHNGSPEKCWKTCDFCDDEVDWCFECKKYAKFIPYFDGKVNRYKTKGCNCS